MENWLLSVQVGLTAVHKLREVDEDFDSEYMLPQLKRDEGVGDLGALLFLMAAHRQGGELIGTHLPAALGVLMLTGLILSLFQAERSPIRDYSAAWATHIPMRSCTGLACLPSRSRRV